MWDGAFTGARFAVTDPLIRLAEVYLNYAEAANEAYGPMGKADGQITALEAVNAIRARAGMPPVLSDFTGSKEALRDRIRNERTVELMFEGKRWFDLVRKALRDGETGPMLDILINHKYETNQKAIRSKMSAMDCLFFPISEREIKTNPLLKQNPAYETEDVYEKN